MTLLHASLLGLLQGFTEFLPISSSGHLALVEHYWELPFAAQTLQHFDIALHGGSLLALLVYFSGTWARILTRPLTPEPNGEPPLLPLLLVSVIPTGLVALVAGEVLTSPFRNPEAIALGLLANSWALLATSLAAGHLPEHKHWSVRRALLMGIAQAAAIVPGLSRSALTITAGRFAKMQLQRTAELSFLMAAPALAGAVLYSAATGLPALQEIGWGPVTVGFFASAAASAVSIHLFLALLRYLGLWPWSIYLFLAGTVVLSWELLPALGSLQERGELLSVPVLTTVAFFAVLIEAIPLTSLFSPGVWTLWVVGVLLRGNLVGLAICVAVSAAAAVIGHLFAYIPSVLARERVHWKRKSDARLRRAHDFFERYGFWSVLVGGWFAPVRPFISVAAGLSTMPWSTYLTAIVVGSLLWTGSILGLSAYLGGVIW